jgi:probable HAF family extracellular repeat protein
MVTLLGECQAILTFPCLLRYFWSLSLKNVMLIVLCALFGLSLAISAQAAPETVPQQQYSYKAYNMGQNVRPEAVNNHDVVVGWRSNLELGLHYAIIWTKEDGLQDIPVGFDISVLVVNSRAYGIDDDGTVVGDGFVNFVRKAWRWKDGVTEILPGIVSISTSTAASVDGDVAVGNSSTDGATLTTKNAVLWNGRGQITNLGTLGNDPDDASYANHVNGNMIVGWSSLNNKTEACYWEWNRTTQSWLPPHILLTPPDLGICYARAVSDDASIIAGTLFTDPNFEACVWELEAAGTYQYYGLGVLPIDNNWTEFGTYGSEATAVSDNGDFVVGFSGVGLVFPRGFVFYNGEMHDLNKESVGLGFYLFFTHATSVNNDGDVVGRVNNFLDPDNGQDSDGDSNDSEFLGESYYGCFMEAVEIGPVTDTSDHKVLESAGD